MSRDRLRTNFDDFWIPEWEDSAYDNGYINSCSVLGRSVW